LLRQKTKRRAARVKILSKIALRHGEVKSVRFIKNSFCAVLQRRAEAVRVFFYVKFIHPRFARYFSDSLKISLLREL